MKHTWKQKEDFTRDALFNIYTLIELVTKGKLKREQS
jgi:hypothetical protein